jgi:hypothetical protein
MLAVRTAARNAVATKLLRSTLLCDEDDEVVVAGCFGVVVIALNGDVAKKPACSSRAVARL